MRLNNREKIPLYNFYNILFIGIVLLGIGLFILEKIKFNLLGLQEYLLLFLPMVLIVIYYYRGRQVFEYDSDSESLTIKNRRIGFLFSGNSNDEFPKYKVQSYQILNVILYKKLYITIHSKKHQNVTLKYDISYLTKKQRNDLKFSLSKIIKVNKEKPVANEN